MGRRDVKRAVREHFLRNPTGMYRVRQLERELGLPLPSVIRYTRELVDEGVLARREIANATFFTADRASGRFLLEKRLFNLRSILASGLVEHLRREYDNPAVVMFGSYALGEDVEESDIDLYVETQHQRIEGLGPFEERLGHGLQLFVYPGIRQVENPRLANNILNGITLNGLVEVF